MKHLKVCQKYSNVRHIFSSLLSASSCDETLHLMRDILLLKFLRSYIDPGGGGGTHHHHRLLSGVPNWLFWLWDLPNLKARIQGLKATWWDSQSKVCWGCGIPKIGVWIMGLRENLRGDYGINKPFGEWRIGKLCYGPKKYLHGRLFYYKHWSQRWKPWYLSGNLSLYNTITFYNGRFFFSLM